MLKYSYYAKRSLGFEKFLNIFEKMKKVFKVYISMRVARNQNQVLDQSGSSLMNFWRTFLKLSKSVFDVDCVDEKSR